MQAYLLCTSSLPQGSCFSQATWAILTISNDDRYNTVSDTGQGSWLKHVVSYLLGDMYGADNS